MDLIQAAWMIRDLGQPVSSLDIEEDSIIAGGWNGALKMWNGDGDVLWSTQCEDRIEAILRIDEIVVVTSGFPRKPGMTREELIGINAGIVNNVVAQLLKYLSLIHI